MHRSRRPGSRLPAALFASLLGASFALAAGCGGAPGTGGTADAPDAASAPAPTCVARASALTPLGPPGQGSTVALGRLAQGPLAGRTLAFVADEDARAVSVVDVAAKNEVARLALGTAPGRGAPSQLLILADGRLVVALRDTSELVVLHVDADATLTRGCAVPTAAEPVALAEAPGHVLVTTGWGHSLQRFDAATLAPRGEVDLPREPRAVVVDDDGRRAYVAHAVGGRISVVDLASMRATAPVDMIINPHLVAERATTQPGPFSLASAVLDGRGAPATGERPIPGRQGNKIGCQGYPITKSRAPQGRVLAPQVLVDPGDPEARAQGYGDGRVPTETPSVAVLDAGTGRVVPASLGATGENFFQRDPSAPADGECILPRAAAVDDATQTLLVTCLGIDAVVAYDAASAQPATVERARWDVASGPMGVAIDPEARQAIVWSQFERSLDVLDLARIEPTDGARERKAPTRIALSAPAEPLPLSFVLGRQIFHTVGDARISRDGRACASCHPDGRDDAITWATPDGPRRTIMLSGRLAGTEPLAWSGQSRDLRDHLDHTFERLDGQGLRSVEREALVAYLEALPPPPVAPASESALADRGRAIFHSGEAACATCHTGGRTDKKTHDLGLRGRADRQGQFDTPSLSYVSGRAPYFHDGRFATLRDVIVGTDGAMGHTKHLAPGDIDALVAYLETL